MKAVRRALGLQLCLSLAGCSGWQSALNPQGPQAQYLVQLIWGFAILCAVIWLLVMVVLALALWRRNRPERDLLVQDSAAEQRYTLIVAGLVIATALTVLALTGWSYASQKKLYAHQDPELTIQITGRQWW